MDLNSAANILIAHHSTVLFDVDDLTIHQLDNGRVLIVKGEHCFLIERDIRLDVDIALKRSERSSVILSRI
ncbi:hypothetical protein VCR12J2_60065 [Vibrio coralliirubri]|nr:hypothetical protein VCR12J2_60065 [Vibrio coralliirubri]